MRVPRFSLGLTVALLACDASATPEDPASTTTSSFAAPGAPDGMPAAPRPDDVPGAPDALPVLPFAARFDERGVYHLDGVPLAFRRPALRRLAAGQDDPAVIRRNAPENYAITTPPTAIADVRPMTEWEPMRALLFAYPSYAIQLSQASDTFVQIAARASDHGEVWVLVDGTQPETIFKQKLQRAGVPDDKIGTSIKFWRTQLETFWFIDYGPLPLVDQRADTYAFADFRYYFDRARDDAVPTLLGRNLPVFGEPSAATVYRVPLTTEGGTFQSTSDGICFTGSRQISNLTCDENGRSCDDSILALSLADLQTHPMTVEMRRTLAAYVGCKDLVVTHSIIQDGTGHIDMYLKVLDDTRVLLGAYVRPFEGDYEEANAALMDDNARFLEAYVKPDGAHFQVVRMRMPHSRFVDDVFGSYEVPFTYINSTFFNGLNLWPAYTFREWVDSRDEAEQTWRQVLPDMDHVWIDAEELSYESGAIHCVTRTVPARQSAPWVADGACGDGLCGGAEDGYDGACELAGNPALCFGPEWLCGCNDCRQCPEIVPDRGCDGIDGVGCCEDGNVLLCQSGALKRIDCADTGCGWDAIAGGYGCGREGADPAGAHRISCGCEPSCGDRTCGDDGCGGSCGECGDGRCVAGTCRDDCAACEPEAVGCEGDIAWRCVAGPEDCHGRERIDCAAAGDICVEGACAAPPVEETPEPSPEVVEPAPEAADTDAPVERDRGDRSSGCAGSDLPPTLLAAAIGAVIAAARRRSRSSCLPPEA